MTESEARKWSRFAMIVATVVAAMNIYVAVFTSILGGFSAWRLADAILMSAFAYGFKKRNPRISAACVIYFAVSATQRWYSVRTVGNVIYLVVLDLIFIQGARAVFAARGIDATAANQNEQSGD